MVWLFCGCVQRYEIVNGVVEVEGVDEAPMIQGDDNETENGKLFIAFHSSMQIVLDTDFNFLWC